MFCQVECNGEKKGTDPFKVEPSRSPCYFLCRLGLFTESARMRWALTLQDLCEAPWAAMCGVLQWGLELKSTLWPLLGSPTRETRGGIFKC